MFVFNSFRLDIANASLQRGKQVIVLAPKAFAVLRYLVEHAGQLVTKDDLWRAIWPGISVTDATLTMCVSELRKALGDASRTPRYIETVHRLGYRFIAPVSTEPTRVSSSRVPGQGSERVRGLSSPSSHFVGRQAELAELHQWLELGLNGKRQIIFVTGEPGIGKTTLVEELLRHEQGCRHESLWIGHGQCIEHYGTGEAYLPVLDALGRLCREAEGGRLLKLLDEYAPSWLIQMPSLIAGAHRRKLQGKTAGTTQARMLRELAEAMEAITVERPLVLWLEDLHWSDYSTLEWLGFLARRQETARLLVLGTYRPVEVILREHPLKHLKQELQIHRQCQELPLALLSEAGVREYVNLRFGSRSTSNLPNVSREAGPACESLRKLAHTIYQRTDGNPLFMVNLVDYLADKRVLKAFDDPVAVHSMEMDGGDRIDTPPSLVQMIERNLERLNADEQAVLEAASVAGAEFAIAAVAAALDRSLNEVEACCTRLSRQHQFIQLKGVAEWPDKTVAAAFQFLHGLYREVLYDRLPAGRRVELHRRIAESEERAWGERAGEIAVELAHHYRKAGQIERTIAYLERAGEQARQRGAFREALEHYQQGLMMLNLLPQSAERELSLLMSLAAALTATKGWAAAELEDVYSRARQFCEQVADSRQLFGVLWGLWAFYWMRGRYNEAYDLAGQLLAVAHNVDAQQMLAVGYDALGCSLFGIGEFSRAREYLEKAVGSLDLDHSDSPASFMAGEELGVVCRARLAMALCWLGYPAQGLQRSNEALSLAQELKSPFNVAFSLGISAILHHLCRDERSIKHQAENLLVIAREHEFVHSVGLATVLLGWALVEQGQTEEGITEIRRAINGLRETAAESHRPFYLALLAEACRKADLIQDGLMTVSEALELVSRTGGRYYEAELHRIKGELLLEQDDSNFAGAEMCFRQAIEVAQVQNAKLLELRASINLARLVEKRGRLDEAYEMLARAYNWFTEGFDTTDLKAAKSLLAQLHAGQTLTSNGLAR